MTNLLDALDRLGEPRLLVLGDLMLDRYAWGETARVSPEAPVPVLTREQEEVRLGGAGSVARLAAALGARVSLAAVVGHDTEGRMVRRLLEQAGVDQAKVLRDPGRPTTTKERFLARVGGGTPQQLLRVDHESRAPLGRVLEGCLTELIMRDLGDCEAVLVADYGKGVCTPELLSRVCEAARERNIPVLVDPARGADYSRYWGASLLAPNRAEAGLALGRVLRTPEEGVEAARELLDRTRVLAVLVKLDRDGMALALVEGPDRVYPTRPRPACDVTGAGDMVLAVLGLCRGAGLCWEEAVPLANVAAGLEVERPGVAPVGRAELRQVLGELGTPARSKLVTLEEMELLANSYRGQGRSLVLANGCFDLLHAGHAAHLEEAARLADVLVVAINDDAGVRRLKGENRPIIGEKDRAALIAALACVGHVLIFHGDTPHEVLRRLRPEVLVKGGDYTPEQVVGREVVEGYGGRVCVTGRVEGVSTTRVLQVLRLCLAGGPP